MTEVYRERCNANFTEATYRLHFKIHALSSRFSLYLTLAAGIPSVFAYILIGSYSDTYGRRLFFYIPLIGTFAKALLSTIGAYFDISIYYWILFVLPESICGSFTSTTCIALAYIADITYPGKRRSVYFGLLEMMTSIGAMMGVVASGYLIDSFGFTAAFVSSIFLLSIPILVILFLLPESLNDKNRMIYASIHERFSTVVSFYVKGNSTTPAEKRKIYVICAAVLVICGVVINGRPTIETEHQTHPPFCWTTVLIGCFFATRMLFQSIVGLGMIRPCQHCWYDETIGIMGAVTCFTSFFVEAFAQTDTELLIVPIVGIGSQVTAPMVRSIMSKMTPPYQQGSLAGSIALVESMAAMLGSAVCGRIYRATVHYMKGAVFLVMACLVIVTIKLLLVLRIKRYIRRRRRKDGNSCITDDDVIFVQAAELEDRSLALRGGTQIRSSYKTALHSPPKKYNLAEASKMSLILLGVVCMWFCAIPQGQCDPNKMLNEDQVLFIMLKVETAIRQDFQRDKQELKQSIDKLTTSLRQAKSDLSDAALQNTLLKKELANMRVKFGNFTTSELKKITDLKSLTTTLLQEVKTIKDTSSVSSNSSTISRITTQSDTNRMQIANVKLEMELMKQSLGSRSGCGQADVGGVESTIQSLKSDVNKLKTAGLNLQSKLNFLMRGQTRKAADIGTPSIAFLAYLTQSKHIYNPGDTLIFPMVDTNTGVAFDNSTGVFTAPVPGIYTFSATITSKSNTSTGYLMRNDQPVAHYSDSKDDDYFRQSSVTVSLHLEQGDRMYILWYGDAEASLVYNFHHTYFSGHLVNRDRFE
ncbi:hypothetical protein FSP39_023526 [Pinctada imbricata]|uniref:Major facilitator superfamily (MFS) profile domain-containing protein n=1 Tax=Pinctada imbricata TaxID=66713 RepID=A0AA88Y5X9_PINIB|nr:hypothetical protein FSP39_023526 [Pinctada imbricata]